MRNDDNWIGKKGVRYWYYRFRDSQYYALSIVAVTIIVCTVLIFNVIIPEFNNWFSIRQEVIATQEKINILQNDIGFMDNLDRNTLENQFETASLALPPQKDLGSMLNAISAAAFASGVSLNDYAFDVGSVSSASGQLTDVRYKGVASIKIVLVVNSPDNSTNGIRHFIAAINNSVPVAEVTNVDGNNQNYSITIQFYQKPFPNVDVSGDQQLEQVSAEKLAILQKLETWKQNSQGAAVPAPPATSSAVPLF